MRRNRCLRLAITLVGLALLMADTAARAGEWGCCSHCPTPVKVCSPCATSIKFECECHCMCPPCSVHFYGTCWHQSPPPDYSHCQSRLPGPTLSQPGFLPLATPEGHLAPAKEKDLPKPRLKEKEKTEATKPRVLNITYHTIDEAGVPLKPSYPVGPSLR